MSEFQPTGPTPMPTLDFDILTYIIWIVQNDKEATSPSAHNPNIPWDYYRACRRTLVALALTCKKLSEPSLRGLWHRMDELLPLLKLIRHFSRNKKPVIWRWVIEGDLPPLNHPDWDRFRYYAGMIQDMRLYKPQKGRIMGEGIHNSVYSRIIDSCSRAGSDSSNVLFPNLSTLDINMGPALTLFQTSTMNLRRVRLRSAIRSAIQIDALTSRFVQDAVTLSQDRNLRSLFLDGITITPAILLQVFRLSSLETIHLSFPITDLATQFVRVLDHEQLNLPNVSKLSISCMDNRMLGGRMPPLRPPRLRLSLPNLQSLLLQGPLDGIAYLGKVLDSDSLRSFTLATLVHNKGFDEASVYRDICDSLSRLSRRFSHSSLLQNITFDFGQTFSHLNSIHVSAFSPLFAFGNLTSLVYEQYAVFIPSDHDLELMGKSWPCLRVLKIRTQGEHTPRATLKGVKALIESCPGLEHLSVTFDARDPLSIPRPGTSSSMLSQLAIDGNEEPNIHIPGDRSNHDRFPSKLRTLDVGESLLVEESVTPIVELLLWLLPELRALSFSGQNFSAGYQNLPSVWADVQKRLIL
ncbi:hypothetical protein BJ165DRAFT_1528777 [Panaeolus papilionaceus]|nr:hypothetical protein BJ165DRAFT_1528777 [Panaeolus papilionaceus]